MAISSVVIATINDNFKNEISAINTEHNSLGLKL